MEITTSIFGIHPVFVNRLTRLHAISLMKNNSVPVIHIYKNQLSRLQTGK